MKQLLFWLVVIAAIAAAGAAGYHRFYASRTTGDQFRTKPVRKSDVTYVVNSTGTVQPVLSVQVGAFVSGPVQNVLVDFNAKVKKGQLLAQIDPRNYKAAVAHEEAALAHAKADLLRVNALLEQAVRNEKRNLRLKNTNAIADTDLDQSVTERKSLDAQVRLADANIQQFDADLQTARTNLDFTDIKSPVDGIVIDRKVDPGQVVAAQFQTPVMFVVAPDLEKKVYVNASVDEADIGLIRDAQRTHQPVTFAVDAYPKDSFQGHIAQVRLNPSTVSNVVTYTVIVETTNIDLKLLPGMTANLAFQIEKHAGVLAVANAALRFHPKAEQVRKRDQPLVDGRASDEPEEQAVDAATSGDKSKDVQILGKKAYVWIVEDDQLAAVPIVTGLTDKSRTEIISGDLAEGRDVIVGMKSTVVKPPGSP